jgi:intracellular multiplication protein IcmC
MKPSSGDIQKSTWGALLVIAILLWPLTSHAQLTLLQAIQNISDKIPHFWLIVTSASKLIGFFFAFQAVMQFRRIGEQRMGMGGSEGWGKPIMSAFIALVFLYWPTVVDMMNIAVYGRTEIFGYADVIPGIKEEYKVIVEVAGGIIQLIGYISFIRGWVLLARVGQHGGQPGAFGKAMMHIIGGLLAINIFGTLTLLGKLVGYY